MALPQNQKLLYIKGYNQECKGNLWEKISGNQRGDKEFIARIYKELHFNNKNKQFNFKIHITPKQIDQKAHEKTLK